MKRIGATPREPQRGAAKVAAAIAAKLKGVGYGG